MADEEKYTIVVDGGQYPEEVSTKDNMRARLSAKPDAKNLIYGDYNISNPMHRIHDTDGLIFPYTPNVTFGTVVSYEEYHSTHAIYKYNAFQKSAPQEINIVADFTAHSITEAQYLIACIQFLRVSCKAYFGHSNPEFAGTPPPVLLFNYLGQFMFKDVPVVIKNFSFVLAPDVDYVTIYSNDHEQQTYVPTFMTMSVTLDTQYNTKVLRDEFDLEAFRSGKLLNKGFI